jgi:hypothetical protein
MIRTIAKLGSAVLILSLVALAADKGPVKLTTKGKTGGTPYQQVDNAKRVPLFSNLATDNPNGLYFCCSGWELTGPDWPYGEYGYQWVAVQFTLTKPRVAHRIITSVTYFESGVYTDFLLSLQADAGGIPSGTPLGSGPWTVTVDSQSFGQCCTAESQKITGGLPLAAGTYWVVWSTEAASDLYAGINDEVLDAVNPQNVAYYSSSAGQWYSYATNDAPAVQVQ